MVHEKYLDLERDANELIDGLDNRIFAIASRNSYGSSSDMMI